MSLVWKLMRRHISLGQLAGFFFANLCGMVIVLLSIQFYQDVAPVFTEGDSFMKKDYIIVSKKVSTLGSMVGKSSQFSSEEIEELKNEEFTKQLLEKIPSGRLGSAEDCAGAAVFLASDEASYVVGADIVVAGGFQL